MRQIKRYADGRFYDTLQKKMIATGRLRALFQAGEEISIIDNDTHKVVTSEVISELFPNIGDDPSGTSDPMGLLNRGQDLISRIGTRTISGWRSRFTSAEDEIDQLVKLLTEDRKTSETEVDRLKTDIMVYARGVKGWIGNVVNKRIQNALSILNLANRGQVIDLTDQIERLGRKMEAIGRFRSKKE